MFTGILPMGRQRENGFPRSVPTLAASQCCARLGGDDGCMYIFLNCYDYFSSSVQL